MEEARHFLYLVLTSACLASHIKKYIFMYVFGRALVVAYESFSCGVSDLVSRLWIEPRPPALEAQSWRLDHQESPLHLFLRAIG